MCLATIKRVGSVDPFISRKGGSKVNLSNYKLFVKRVKFSMV